MKLISVNVGLPREVSWHDRVVQTSIWKNPVQGRVHVAKLNLDGDRQSDLSVHGGVDKAVYVYPSEHYPFWKGQLPGEDLGWGAFGENLTTEGLLEDQVQIGDRLRIGTAEFVVTQPRMPCYKLGIRFGRPDLVKRFLQSRKTGFYLAVEREGDLAAGDAIEFIERSDGGLTILDVTNLYAAGSPSQDQLRRAADLPALPESWREYFQKKLGDR
ncbi:MAG TPA: MOSC domain-containing protein [Chthoniobacterales bacterium]|jgi:MOSC domain-containing protein YiiM